MKPIGIILIIFSSCLATAGSWEHLGAPPKGSVLFKLKSAGALEPIQITGTIDPPFLLVNGNSAPLETYPPSAGETPPRSRVAVNGKDIQVEGLHGRFFESLPSSESAVDALTVTLVSAQGVTYEAWVPVNRVFIETPLSITETVPVEKLTKVRSHEFQIRGALPPDFGLSLKGGACSKDESGVGVDCRIGLPLGRSVMVATVTQADGIKRLINVPVTVTTETYDDRGAVLSLDCGDQRPGEVLVIPPKGLILKGVTNPGARLSVDGTPVTVGPDGGFSADVKGYVGETNISFQVGTSDGKKHLFAKPARCPDCEAPFIPGPYSLLFGTMHISHLDFYGDGVLNDNGYTTYPAPMLSLGLLRRLSGTWSAEARVSNLGSSEDKFYPGQIRTSDIFRAEIGATKRLWTHFSAGAGVTYVSNDLYSYNFSLPVSWISTLLVSVHIEGDFKFWRRWAYTPRLDVDSSAFQLGAFNPPIGWTDIHFEFLLFRYDL